MATLPAIVPVTPTEVKPGRIDIDSGDHDRFTHIVFTPGHKANPIVTQSYVEGRELIALCGKKFKPARDPERFPICPECKAIKEKILQGG